MLHAGPYKGNLEDRLAFLTSLCLTLSLLLGLCLMMDDPSNPIFPADTIGIILIVINVLPFVHFLFSCVQLIRNGSGEGIGKSVANGTTRTMQPTLSLSLPDAAEKGVAKLNSNKKITPQKSIKVTPVESKPVDQGSESFAEQRIARSKSRRSRPNMSLGTDSMLHI